MFVSTYCANIPLFQETNCCSHSCFRIMILSVIKCLKHRAKGKSHWLWEKILDGQSRSQQTSHLKDSYYLMFLLRRFRSCVDCQWSWHCTSDCLLWVYHLLTTGELWPIYSRAGSILSLKEDLIDFIITSHFLKRSLSGPICNWITQQPWDEGSLKHDQ